MCHNTDTMWHTENRIPRYTSLTTTKSIPKFSALRLKRSGQGTGYGERKIQKLKALRLVLGLLQVVGTVKTNVCVYPKLNTVRILKIFQKQVCNAGLMYQKSYTVVICLNCRYSYTRRCRCKHNTKILSYTYSSVRLISNCSNSKSLLVPKRTINVKFVRQKATCYYVNTTACISIICAFPLSKCGNGHAHCTFNTPHTVVFT